MWKALHKENFSTDLEERWVWLHIASMYSVSFVFMYFCILWFCISLFLNKSDPDLEKPRSAFVWNITRHIKAFQLFLWWNKERRSYHHFPNKQNNCYLRYSVLLSTDFYRFSHFHSVQHQVKLKFSEVNPLIISLM